jgi:hypothetical protein
MLFFGEGHIGELLEAGDEGAAKAVEAITVGEDGGVLDAVEVAADLFRSVDTVIKVGDEAGDSALEIDVVFPKRVIGVDEQCLVGGATERLARVLVLGRHRLIIKVQREGTITKVRLVCHAWGMYPQVGLCQIGSND